MKAHPANQVSRKHPSSHLKSLCVRSQLHWIKPIVLGGRGGEKKNTQFYKRSALKEMNALVGLGLIQFCAKYSGPC